MKNFVFLLWLITTVTGISAQVSQSLALKNEVLFSVGGNLNFVEKAQVSGLYYDVNVFWDPLFSTNGGRKSRLGIDARLNQGKYVAQPDTFENREWLFSTSDPAKDSFANVLVQRYDYVRNEVPTYLTLSLTPTYRLGKDDNFPLFLAVHFEYIQRKNAQMVENIIQEEVAATYNWADLPGTLFPFKIENGKRTINSRSDNFNYALGFKFFKEFNDATVNIKPMLGFGSNGNSEGLFYLTHFEVIERKFGFKIGGELRGIVRPKIVERGRERDYEPYVALYFAKTFRFSKLMEILKL